MPEPFPDSQEGDKSTNWGLQSLPHLEAVSITNLQYDVHLPGYVQSALEVESADMVLVTLRRFDESILRAPHMIRDWKKLLQRLIDLDHKKALKYVSDMSLYWKRDYLQDIIEGIKGDSEYAFHHKKDYYVGVLQSIQDTGNMIDDYSVDTWCVLMRDRISKNEPIEDILLSILHTFKTSPLGSGRYQRDIDGVRTSVHIWGINTYFSKRATAMYLELLNHEELTSTPFMALHYLECVMSVMTTENYPEAQEKFYTQWENCVRGIAALDISIAESIIKEENIFPQFSNQKSALLSEIRSQDSGIQAELGKKPDLFDVATNWAIHTQNRDEENIKYAKEWKKMIIEIGENDPERALDEIYDSLSPFLQQLCLPGVHTYAADIISGTVEHVITAVMGPDTTNRENQKKALALCIHIFHRDWTLGVYFSKKFLLETTEKLIQNALQECPDLALKGYICLERYYESSDRGQNYLENVSDRHAKISAIIPSAAEKSLLSAIDGCERLLRFNNQGTALYDETLTLWRIYMSQLESRHAATALHYFSEFQGFFKGDKNHPLYIECDKGYDHAQQLKAREATIFLPPTFSD